MAQFKVYYTVPGAGTRMTKMVEAHNSTAARRLFEAGNPGAKVQMVS